ncbi:MAG: DUF3095 domain-containing protein [Nodosilinea sp. WJT8-NPBG4]|jgi:hypothetical protein|nr:DUF3095 domain-containing protein [Nodosilinea sp. WJT8-NPBG4]
MSTERFYADLPAIDNLLSAIDANNLLPVPSDWYIIIADVRGSTEAIEAGRYKEVNLLGASSIAAVLNAVKPLEIPYVFGGDGASLLVPSTVLEKVKSPLLALQQLAQREFNLELRVGIVPVTTASQAGFEVKLAKLKVADQYHQAVFVGGGLNHATELVKSSETAGRYQISDVEISQADLAGLECRWQDIASRHGETVTLLVLATAHSPAANNALYHDVLEKIQEIYGTEDDFHPVGLQNLNLSLKTEKLLPQAKLRSQPSNWLSRWRYIWNLKMDNILGSIYMRLNLKVGGINWGAYKQVVQAASDYKKFDDMLRMIISGDTNQREKLTDYLEIQSREGNLVYGIHVSDRALMTCLVFERNGHEVHFVDGADGGYTLAAKPLKEKLKRKAANWQAYTRMVGLREKLSSQGQNSNLGSQEKSEAASID